MSATHGGSPCYVGKRLARLRELASDLPCATPDGHGAGDPVPPIFKRFAMTVAMLMASSAAMAAWLLHRHRL
jgi:hypothetical protein